jgi:hypothetical protein
MDTALQHMHSGLRWLLLLVLVIAVFKALFGGGTRFFEKDIKLALVVMILAHIQLLIGFALYFINGHFRNFDQMDIPVIRFFAVEHMMGMLLAIILITIGYGKAKRGKSDVVKTRAIKVYYGIALIIILASIPWPFRPGFEAMEWF